MANKIKGLWLIVLLVAVSVVIFFLSVGQNKTESAQGVVLQEIFNQKATQPSFQAKDLVTQPVVVTKAAPKEVDPVPSMAIVTSPVAGREAGFAIQVYSFQDKNRAEAALNSLKNNGYKAFEIVSDLGEKGTWYRIRVGDIADEAAAKKVLDQIRKSYNSGFIIKPTK